MKIKFIDPMECLAVSKLPEGPQWVYEIKLDGYPAEAIHTADGVAFYSRNGKSLNKKFPYIVEALADLPIDTIIDVVLKGRDLTSIPFSERRKLLALLPFTNRRIGVSEFLTVSAETMLAPVKQQGLEGVVAKRVDSLYEAGKRSGAWVKHRVNLGQEFVIGGYTPGPNGIDAIIVGYYKGGDPIYVARNPQRVRARVTAECLSAVTRTEDRGVPVHQSAGDAEGKVGRGIDRWEDEGMRVGSTGTRGTNRVS